MRAFGHFFLIAVMSAASLPAQNATDPAATVVLNAAREALGGEKKLAAVKTIVATGRTRQVRGENLVPIEFEIAIELPDKYVRKDEIPAQESEPTTVGFNGSALIQLPEPAAGGPPQRAGAPAPTPAQLETARTTRLSTVKQDFARLALGMFAGSFSSFPLTFSYVAKAEAPQGKADVLEVKGPANFSARLFVNADTHLPIMVSWVPPAPPQRGGRPGGPGGADAGRGGPPGRGAPPPPPGQSAAPGRGPASPPPETRIYYADYRDVNGMQFPFRLRRAVGADTVEETTFDVFKINGKIDPKRFEVKR